MKRSDFPMLGYGVGLRRQHYSHVLETRPKVDWFEVISENFMVAGGRALEVLEGVRANYPIAMHGVSMSIGSTDPLNRSYLRQLRDLARRFEPAWISDHLCWTGVGGRNLHDLLPLPYTEEAIRHVVARIREVQDVLERPILIENVSSYMAFADSTMTEWEFISAIADEADCGILLDINNIFVSAFNHRFDANDYIDAVPAERVVQYHLAGHSDHGTYLLDTHDHPVRDEVWALYERAARRFGAVSAMVEWDDNIPEFAELADTADRARTDFQCRLNLKELESLLYRLITAPSGVAEGLAAERDLGAGGLDAIVLGDDRLSAEARVDIYANMYFYRILDALKEDFPATLAVLGDDNFHNLVTGYLLEYPPTEPSISHCGQSSRRLSARSSDARGRAVYRRPREARTRGRRGVSRSRCGGAGA